MKLYYSPGACSLAPHIVLREVEARFSLERVDTGTHKTERGTDFYTINPKGYVPVLELDSGERLTEGPIIAQYVADKANRLDLMPAHATLARYRVMEWQNYITAELHKSFGPLFAPGYEEGTKTLFKTALSKRYDWVSDQLRGKQYLTGDTFTAADAYMFTVTNWARHVGLDLKGLADLQAYLGRVASRPAVQQAMKAEGLKV